MKILHLNPFPLETHCISKGGRDPASRPPDKEQNRNSAHHPRMGEAIFGTMWLLSTKEKTKKGFGNSLWKACTRSSFL